MQLTCPHCQFSKEIPAAKLPATPTRVTCPQCRESFTWPVRSAEPVPQSRLSCPVCHLEQAETRACASCGLIFARYQSAQQSTSATAPGHPDRHDNLTDTPKAGFWLRLVALLIDGFLVFLLQVIFSILLMFAGSSGFHLDSSISVLIQLFSMILSIFYWVFFTGYCGQTPGKMLLRIKVIGIGGEPLSYGQAFYREVVGKFISGIILCIGYLMAAFDDQKQGLHDRMAKTFVIKL